MSSNKFVKLSLLVHGSILHSLGPQILIFYDLVLLLENFLLSVYSYHLYLDLDLRVCASEIIKTLDKPRGFPGGC